MTEFNKKKIHRKKSSKHGIHIQQDRPHHQKKNTVTKKDKIHQEMKESPDQDEPIID